MRSTPTGRKVGSFKNVMELEEEAGGGEGASNVSHGTCRTYGVLFLGSGGEDSMKILFWIGQCKIFSKNFRVFF